MTASSVFVSKGQDDVFAGDRFRHEFDDRFRDRDFGQIDVIAAVLLGDGPHHVFAGGVAELDQAVGQVCWLPWPSAGLR